MNFSNEKYSCAEKNHTFFIFHIFKKFITYLERLKLEVPKLLSKFMRIVKSDKDNITQNF